MFGLNSGRTFRKEGLKIFGKFNIGKTLKAEESKNQKNIPENSSMKYINETVVLNIQQPENHSRKLFAPFLPSTTPKTNSKLVGKLRNLPEAISS
jgi:hypothetical protein